MAWFRLPERVAAGRREAPLLPAPGGPQAAPTPRHLLLHSWAGRLFLVSAALKFLFAILRQVATLPRLLEILSTLATLGLLVALFYFLWRLTALAKQRLLWRVRRKLIISYIFIGVVPALLIVGFFLLTAGVLSMSLSAYLFKDGYDAIVESAGMITQAAANDIARDPRAMRSVLERTRQVARNRYPTLDVSVAFVPRPNSALPPEALGEWEHLPPPQMIPAWARTEGFAGTIPAPLAPDSDEVHLVIRAVRHARGPAPQGFAGSLVMDIVIDDHALDFLYERTSVKGGRVWLSGARGGSAAASAVLAADREGGALTLFRNSVTIIECTQWVDGTRPPPCQAAIATRHNVRDLWTRLTAAQSLNLQGAPLGQWFLVVFGILAILFLLIQSVALVMGLALARSITSSIHELFTGTERVQHGDFTHRIRVASRDQLGELAQSFNQMTGSIEGLLQTAAEKKRLDEELRIARQIQMSLLPRGPLDVPGLSVTALCVPAREVGGDYYDLFHLPNERLGVLIADVAGKGTSAALYMAELKGLVLALSQTKHSPRELLIDVNRIISENLDSRSFITMTYGVIDPHAGELTYCRAGHTPLIFLPGPRSELAAGAHVLAPDGLVVGLRIPGAAEKFADLLVEERLPLSTGDVIVLYTDGITEAMNAENDLFGDSRLSRIVEEHGHLASGELRERILREIEAFVGGADQHDDMTMILVKVEKGFDETHAAGRAPRDGNTAHEPVTRSAVHP